MGNLELDHPLVSVQNLQLEEVLFLTMSPATLLLPPLPDEEVTLETKLILNVANGSRLLSLMSLRMPNQGGEARTVDRVRSRLALWNLTTPWHNMLQVSERQIYQR